MTQLDTQGVILSFGKHKGQLLTRVPISYIRWMATNDVPQSDYARAEFERRGDTMPKVEISGHAIDRASLRVLQTWRATRNEDEGLYSWLQRMVLEALKSGHRLDGGKIKYRKIKWVIEEGEVLPVLKSVMK
jgi:hypothetical protein